MEPLLDDVVSMTIFAAVVETRSFTAAATRVGLAKSAVSARIASLERRLGVRLLHRTTRRLSLTRDGALVYEACVRLVSAAQQATEIGTRASSAPRGTLRVNAPTSFAQKYLAQPIVTFMKRYPEVKLDLQLTEKRIDPVAGGIDVTLRVAQRNLKDSSLIVRRLASTPVLACASPGYIAARGAPETPADLLTHDCLGFSVLTAREQWSFRSGKTTYAIPVLGRCMADSGGMLLELARAGLGIVMAPWFFVSDDIARGTLALVLDDFRGDDAHLYALHPHAELVPPKVRVFVDHLVAEFASAKWPRDPKVPKPKRSARALSR